MSAGMGWWLALLLAVLAALVRALRRRGVKQVPAVAEAPGASSSRLTAEPHMSWSLDLLRQLEWARVEELCEGLWKARGHAAVRQPPGPARGAADIVVGEPGNADRVHALLRCEPFINGVAGPDQLEALHRAAGEQAAPLAVFYALAGFTEEAVQYAVGTPLQLRSAAELFAELCALPEEPQLELLDEITYGDYMTPSCPRCGEKLLRQHGIEGRPAWWGCPRFPACRGRI
ncbi:restriction endonuclease [Solimonas sp. K1W22B-7]|uniref:restriction endonuclease n=1 Tax=Solimonas sp. K1W22B-7 TaxID=2303331 RepID=UPI0013C3F0BB|nr:restriction endonuclease [Solimonas sp. K1W22B-7]